MNIATSEKLPTHYHPLENPVYTEPHVVEQRKHFRREPIPRLGGSTTELMRNPLSLRILCFKGVEMGSYIPSITLTPVPSEDP